MDAGPAESRRGGRPLQADRSMRTIVAGGSGFVGRRVVRRLLGEGHDVVNLDAVEPAAAEPGESVLTGDLSEISKLPAAAAACAPAGAVVWLPAAIRQRTAIDASAAWDVRLMVEAPMRFLEALSPAPASFVYMSSIQVYGVPVRLPVDEEHPTEPFTAYGAAKLLGEQMLAIACAKRGVAFAALRAAFVYGPGQHEANVIPRFLEAVRQGRAPVVHGDGKGLRDDVHVDDVARAVAAAIDKRASGVFNVATGTPHSIADLAEAACRLGGGTLRPGHEQAESGWIDRYFAVELARRELGFQAEIGIEEGLKSMWAAGEER